MTTIEFTWAYGPAVTVEVVEAEAAEYLESLRALPGVTSAEVKA